MKQKMLVLPMKKKWFYMILSGVKKEEYRVCKPYWRRRVANWLFHDGIPYFGLLGDVPLDIEKDFNGRTIPILFVNGYGAKAPRFIGWCKGYSIRSTVRHEEWGEGAYEGIGHFCFHIVRVERS